MLSPEFKSIVARRLLAYEQQNQYRKRPVVTPVSGALVKLNGQECINFCSNDYLGLALDEKIKNQQQQAMLKFGAGAGASQLVSGYSSSHKALEDELAEFLQRPRVVVFSSGFLANLGMLTALADKSTVLLLDRLCHASLVDGARYSQAQLKRYRHCDSVDLQRRLHVNQAKQVFVVSDGVFSMDGDVAPLAAICELADQYKALTILDDAHGIGVIGANARGSIELSGVNTESIDLLVGTFGKAFGTFGAFVSASEELAEVLIQAARTLIYTTALPPAIVECTRTSLQMIKSEAWRRQKLQENIDYFRYHAQASGITLTSSATAIQPILVGDSQSTLDLSAKLLQSGYWVSAIRPPTVPKGTARLRIALSCLHEKPQIDSLIVALQSNSSLWN